MYRGFQRNAIPEFRDFGAELKGYSLMEVFEEPPEI